jgi:hypothetical protein
MASVVLAEPRRGAATDGEPHGNSYDPRPGHETDEGRAPMSYPEADAKDLPAQARARIKQNREILRHLIFVLVNAALWAFRPTTAPTPATSGR